MAEKKNLLPHRFETGKQLFKDADRIRGHPVKISGGKRGPRTVAAGPSALLAALAVWMFCDGRSGQVTMSVSRLAALIGGTRHTARRAIAALVALEIITPATRKDGKPIKGKWLVDHTLKED